MSYIQELMNLVVSLEAHRQAIWIIIVIRFVHFGLRNVLPCKLARTKRACNLKQRLPISTCKAQFKHPRTFVDEQLGKTDLALDKQNSRQGAMSNFRLATVGTARWPKNRNIINFKSAMNTSSHPANKKRAIGQPLLSQKWPICIRRTDFRVDQS